MKTLLTALFSVLFIYANAQHGEVYGTITDLETQEVLPNASVQLLRNNMPIAQAIADENGLYVLKPIPVGTYSISVSYTMYQTKIFENQIQVREDAQTRFNAQLSSDNTLPTVVISANSMENKKIIDIDPVPTFTPDMIEKSAVSPMQLITLVPSVTYNEGTNEYNIRGARGDANAFYIDGVRIIGNIDLPKYAIAQIRVITGGIPAKYGDLTGGVILVTSKSYWNN